MHQHSHYRGLRKRERERGSEKIFEDIIAEKFPNIENSQPSPGSTESQER